MALLINIHLIPDVYIPVEIIPGCTTVYKLKHFISSQQHIPADNFKIIFQGRELLNDFSFEGCDLGNHSVLHAVHIKQSVPTLDVHSTSEEQHNQLHSLPLSSLEPLPETYRTQFYVYCKVPCQQVQPGKLRVRCASCRRGTFLLDRDPQNWDDVLQPGQISGLCQQESCGHNIAEFYFKCGSHGGDEQSTAVALHLIKANSRHVHCLTCLEERNPVLVFPCESGHSICLDCFTEYCSIKLSERSFIQCAEHGYTLDCPAGCENSFIKEAHHFRILGQEEYDRYQRFGTEECVLQLGGVLCPQPGCGAGLLPEEGERRVLCERQGTQGCGFEFCRQCLEEYHAGDCDNGHINLQAAAKGYTVDPKKAEKARWDQQSKDTIKKTTKPCPKCKVPVEKAGGCMHMKCARCSFQWCWLCCKVWDYDCQADHWFGN